MAAIRYSLQNSTLGIGGRIIQGFGPDDYVVFKRQPLAEVARTADGFTVVSGNRSNDLEAEITIMQGSPGYKDLWELSEQQRADFFSGIFDFVWAEPTALGDSVRCGDAQFTQQPDAGYQRQAQSQTFNMILPTCEVRFATAL